MQATSHQQVASFAEATVLCSLGFRFQQAALEARRCFLCYLRGESRHAWSQAGVLLSFLRQRTIITKTMLISSTSRHLESRNKAARITTCATAACHWQEEQPPPPPAPRAVAATATSNNLNQHSDNENHHNTRAAPPFPAIAPPGIICFSLTMTGATSTTTSTTTTTRTPPHPPRPPQSPVERLPQEQAAILTTSSSSNNQQQRQQQQRQQQHQQQQQQQQQLQQRKHLWMV